MQSFINIDDYKNIHFIGIGGVSMSSLAMMLKEKGKTVTGSDANVSQNTKMLESNGVTVYHEHNAKNAHGAELIVYTAAISDKNPELVYAKQNSIPTIERAVLLGALMSSYKNSIAISGTHGKTTTTSMVSSIFLSADTDPTIHIGAHFDLIDGNYKTGRSNYSIYEACEYVNSFFNFYPDVAVILNIDADHLDFFKTLDNIKQSFLTFTQNVSDDGAIIINGDDINCSFIIDETSKKTVTFGLNTTNDCYPLNISIKNGRPVFDVCYKNEIIEGIQLSVLGEHNILNALSAICCAKHYGIANNHIINGIKNFKGADRRFEIKKFYNDAAIVDDYAHHPTEIRATIKSARMAGYKKVTVIFQSHTYTRTKFLMQEFANELSLADKIVLTDIYSAREINTVGANVIDLKNMLENCIYISDFNDIAEFIKQDAEPNNVYILMGAGNINSVADLI